MKFNYEGSVKKTYNEIQEKVCQVYIDALRKTFGNFETIAVNDWCLTKGLKVGTVKIGGEEIDICVELRPPIIKDFATGEFDFEKSKEMAKEVEQRCKEYYQVEKYGKSAIRKYTTRIYNIIEKILTKSS